MMFRTCRILRLPSASSSCSTSVIRAYLVLFNECNLANLLETVMFHGSAAVSLGDDVVLDVTVIHDRVWKTVLRVFEQKKSRVTGVGERK